jgi:membrane-associated phospholipid phosphatase
MKQFSNIISWIFIPLFMPIYGLLIAMYIPTISKSALLQQHNLYALPYQNKLNVLFLYFILIVLAPGLSLLMMKRQKRISDLQIDNRQERTYPLIITVIYGALLGIFLWTQIPKHALSPILFGLPWAGALAGITATIVNRFEKISLHGIGAGMLFGFILSYYQMQSQFYMSALLGVILLGGIILTSRMYLEKHTLREAISGYLLGFFSTFIVLKLFINYLPQIV